MINKLLKSQNDYYSTLFYVFQSACCFLVESDRVVRDIEHLQSIQFVSVEEDNIENLLVDVVACQVYIADSLQVFGHLQES